LKNERCSQKRRKVEKMREGPVGKKNVLKDRSRERTGP